MICEYYVMTNLLEYVPRFALIMHIQPEQHKLTHKQCSHILIIHAHSGLSSAVWAVLEVPASISSFGSGSDS